MASFRELSSRTQIIAMGVLSVALTFAAEYTLAQPKAAANGNLADKVAKLKDTNEHLRPLVNQVARLTVQNQQLELQWEAVQTRLPIMRSSDDFIRELETTAQTSNITIRKISSSKATAQQLYTEAPYTLQLDGAYPDVLDFFDRLAHLARIVSVGDWSMLALHSGTSGVDNYKYREGETLSTQCEISAYYSPEVLPVAAAPAKGAKKAK